MNGSTNIETISEDNVLNTDRPTTLSTSVVGDTLNSEGIPTINNDQPVADSASALSATAPISDKSQQLGLAEANGSANPSKNKKNNNNKFEELMLFRSKATKENNKLDKKPFLLLFTTTIPLVLLFKHLLCIVSMIKIF